MLDETLSMERQTAARSLAGEVLATEDRNRILGTRTENFQEGLRAFLQKRAREFEDA